jgi:excinuclease UvrABC nuclease subunit
MEDASRGERFEEAAQLRDAMRTVQTLRDRQQKVATAGLGDRDVFGIKGRPQRWRDSGLSSPRRPRRPSASS